MKLNLYRLEGAIQLIDPNNAVIRHEKGVFPVFLDTIEVTEPKKVVTKEVSLTMVKSENSMVSLLSDLPPIPQKAKNIRILYDIEE